MYSPESQDSRVRTAHRDFSGFVHDYHRAFSGQGENLLHRTIDVLSRQKTFKMRREVVRRVLEAARRLPETRLP